MTKRLWDKGGVSNPELLEFTVGNDPELDRELLYWDAAASAAHARMLGTIGVLSAEECKQLLEGLQAIAVAARQGEFPIPPELEDGHTAIEAELSAKIGPAGRKIHTGRSRNDQVLTAMRLYMRQQLLTLLSAELRSAQLFLNRARELGHIVIPGYTHMQPAMPASIAMWLQAFAEALLEHCAEGLELWAALGANPLGVAAGFGCPLPLDRDMTAALLGFERVQRNPINVQNSRGHLELRFVRWCGDSGAIIEKFAWDAILYSSAPYGFISLPESLTTGSSIMPQKRNPDVLELLRGRVAKLRGAAAELQWVCGKLPSNYHRDLQYTKEPVLRSAANLAEMLKALYPVVGGLGVNHSACAAAQTPELYATYDAYQRVKAGQPFRDAYQAAAAALAAGQIKTADLQAEFQQITTVLDQEWSAAQAELTQYQSQVTQLAESFTQRITAVFQFTASSESA